MNIYRTIRKAREARGLSQVKLAALVSDAIGETYKQPSVAAWEMHPSLQRARRVPPQVVEALAGALGLDPLEIVGGDSARARAPATTLAAYPDVLLSWVKANGVLTITQANGRSVARLTAA